MTRRTQAERSDATTALLITTAQRLFGAHGYAATSIDAVAAAAGVTKGAVYHHFGGKTALFRAVFVREQEEIAVTLERVAFGQSDGWAALRRGCRTFLEHCLDPGFRQIVILDGPSVLGWETVREIEYGHALRVLLDGMRLAQAEGLFAEGDLPARAQLVFGALCEGGMLLARAADPVAALPGLAAEADRLLEAFKV